MRFVIAIAALIILAAIIYLSMRLGRHLERKAMKRQVDRIDPQTYHEMSNLLRRVFGPVDHVDDVVVVPKWMREQANPILIKIGTATRAEH